MTANSTRFTAACVGCAVPRRDFAGAVHSAFAGAVNLQPEGGACLVTLLPADESDLPQGIRLDTPAGFTFDGVRPGSAFTCQAGVLTIESAGFSADLRAARRWKCDLPALAVDLDDPRVLRAWGWAAERVGRRQAEAESGAAAVESAALARVGALAAELRQAVRHHDQRRAAACAAGLIGLGPGLTPFGDDLLVGFLAGLWSAAGQNPARRRSAASLGRAVARRGGRTNAISRTYLVLAARGQVSSRLAGLAEAVAHGADPDRLGPVVDESLQPGHLSGLAATAGLLLGLAAWNDSAAEGRGGVIQTALQALV